MEVPLPQLREVEAASPWEASTLLATPFIGWEPTIPSLRQSYVSCLMDCPRKSLFRYHYGLGVPGRREALEVGTLFHLILAEVYSGKTKNDGFLKAEARAKADQEAAVQANQGFGGGALSLERLIESIDSDLALAKVLGDVFLERYPAPNYRPLGDAEVLVRAKAVGLEAALEGTVDVALLDEGRGEIWLMDHKTTSILAKARAAQGMLELQPRLYRLLVQLLFPEYPVVGFIHNIIKKPTIRLSDEDRDYTERDHVLKSGPRKGQTEKRREYVGFPKFDNYLKRCRSWYAATGDYADKAEEWLRDPPILQAHLRFGEPIYNTELFTVLREADGYANAAPDLNRFYRRWTSCLGKYGNSICEYMGLCTSAPVTWKEQVRTGFCKEETR